MFLFCKNIDSRWGKRIVTLLLFLSVCETASFDTTLHLQLAFEHSHSGTATTKLAVRYFTQVYRSQHIDTTEALSIYHKIRINCLNAWKVINQLSSKYFAVADIYTFANVTQRDVHWDSYTRKLDSRVWIVMKEARISLRSTPSTTSTLVPAPKYGEQWLGVWFLPQIHEQQQPR